MADHGMTDLPSRKLAVLLHADVVDSTTLVQRDETLAHQRIQDAFRRLSYVISEHGGIAHEIRGDALVAEFSMASDAVAASVDFQIANDAHNQALRDDVRPVLRMGIALGEVVVADQTVTGEGVVLAQRLEQLAEPGGICLQGAAYETVPKRLPFEYADMGDRELKGFDLTYRVFSVRSKTDAPSTPAASHTGVQESSDKPAIAVLPFINMSGDAEQEYFSDGITEDIITELSRFRSISVIARTSSFTYKGKEVPVGLVGEQLGVSYVLEGSVRKAGARVRINAQLVEAATGTHVWAERYDRELTDIFAVQDELTKIIVGTIAGRVDAAEAQRVAWKPPASVGAYDLFLRGLQEFNREEVPACLSARELFRKAIGLDPRYARAYAYLALTHLAQVFYLDASSEGMPAALDAAEVAVTLDPDDSFALGVQGAVLCMLNRDDEGLSKLREAVRLNPNDAEVMHWLGYILGHAMGMEEGIGYVREAMRLNPVNHLWHNSLGVVLCRCGQYAEAVEQLKRYATSDWKWTIANLAAAHAHLGNIDEARALANRAAELRRQQLEELGEPVPDSSLALFREAFDKFYPGRERVLANLYEGLRKAGLS